MHPLLKATEQRVHRTLRATSHDGGTRENPLPLPEDSAPADPLVEAIREATQIIASSIDEAAQKVACSIDLLVDEIKTHH